MKIPAITTRSLAMFIFFRNLIYNYAFKGYTFESIS